MAEVLMGFGVSLALALLASPVIRAVVKNKPAPKKLKDDRKRLWGDWEAATEGQMKPGGAIFIGILEVTVFFWAAYLGAYNVIAGWLVFKAGVKWGGWQHVIAPPPKGVPFKNDEIGNLWARHHWGARVLQRLMLGTLYNLVSAAVGVGAASALPTSALASWARSLF